MSTTFTGQVTQIFDLESLTTRDGRPFTKRRFLVQTVEQYPQRVLLTVINDLATNFPKAVGDIVTAHLSFDVNTNADQTRYFNDIRAWRID